MKKYCWNFMAYLLLTIVSVSLLVMSYKHSPARAEKKINGSYEATEVKQEEDEFQKGFEAGYLYAIKTAELQSDNGIEYQISFGNGELHNYSR